MKQAPIYIVGHKNPDLDAICSALAYQAFKEATGQKNYQAIRCGSSSARIDTTLERFGVALPPFVGDLTPRVGDIMTEKVYTVGLESTCFEALALIDEFDVRALPVVMADGKLAGLISIFNLGEYFVPKPSEPKKMRRVRTSIAAIIRSLKATIVCQGRIDAVEDYFVRIAAMSLNSFAELQQRDGLGARQGIVVVGDRADIQQKAIQMGFRLLVVTGNRSVEMPVIKAAQEADITIIQSSYDSATTSWIVRAAEFIEPLIQRDILTCQVDEKLTVARKRVMHSSAATIPVVNEEGCLVGVFSRGDLSRPIAQQIVLVDHNELSQAIDGASEVNIVEIVDHHRLGNPPSAQPILFHNEPIGSTCSIIASFFKAAGLTPSPSTAGLMMAGMISDTLNLRSPTATQKDAALLAWLSSIAGISAAEVNTLIFSSGSVLATLPADEVVRADCKVYDSSNGKYAIAQVEELGLDHFWKRLDELEAALQEFCKHDKLIFAALLVTDVNTQNSLMLIQGDAGFIERINYPTVQRDHIFDMPGIVSRKKQLTPYLTGLLES